MDRDLSLNVVILLPKEPMLEWARTVWKREPELSMDELTDNLTVINIGRLGKHWSFERWLEENWQEIFEHELNAWAKDQTQWPEKRSLGLFKTWFKAVPTFDGFKIDGQNAIL
jgi:hypothetical protein